MDGASTSSPEWVHGTKERRALTLLQNAVILANWKTEDFKTYTLRGGRTRIRALSDWITERQEREDITPEKVAKDKSPMKSLLESLRSLQNKGFKKYRLNQVASQVSLLYENFFEIKNMGRNKILRATLDEVAENIKPPQKYTDVMPIEKIIDWIDAQGDNERLSRFQLYRKFIVTIQVACIARAADIFRLRFSTLEEGHPKGAITFVTQTKTSQRKGFYLYLFGIPTKPNVCPIRTTLSLKKKWEREKQEKKWVFDKDTIHVNEQGTPLTRADQVGNLLREIHKEAGIDIQRWSPNNARHAVITFYKAAGIPEPLIKLITGHAAKSTITQDFYTLPLLNWSERSILASSTNKTKEPTLPKEGVAENNQPVREVGITLQHKERDDEYQTGVKTKREDSGKGPSTRKYPVREHHFPKRHFAEEWTTKYQKGKTTMTKRIRRVSPPESNEETRDEVNKNITDTTNVENSRDPGSQ
jgi:hypothetical protein